MVDFFLKEHLKLRMQMADKFNETSKLSWVNAKDQEGFTCLHYSVFRGNFKMVKMLEENGADIYQINNQGLTVMHIAAQGGYPLLLVILKRFSIIF
jgi:ankyrin repeat protein